MARASRGAALTGCAVMTLMWFVPAAADDEAEVCSSRFLAYEADTKVPRSRRVEGREGAEDRAFLDLAQQAFATGNYRERIEVERRVQAAFEEDIRLVQAGRKYYGVNDLLHGGTYHSDGDKSTLSVWYCLPAERFGAARAELRRERDADVGRVRGRMRELEMGVTRDELAWATEEMSSLLGDIQSRVMETETYTSPLTGEEKSFRGWLARWRAEVQRGNDYAMQLIEEASRKVDEGHLSVAGDLLDEAVEADPTNPRARQVRLQIGDRRAEASKLLKEAGDKAAVGKFSAAQRDLERAEQIDGDDAAQLHTATRNVENRKKEYLSNNPRVRGEAYLALGGLGADVGGASDAYEATTGGITSPNFLTTIGLACQVRLGRYGVFSGSGGYGFSNFNGQNGDSSDDGFYHYGEFLAGFGIRTVRTAARPLSFVALGGVTKEYVSIDVNTTGLDSSDARAGTFARLGVEWKVLTVYVQQAFGFDDPGDPEESLVRWHNGTQFAMALHF